MKDIDMKGVRYWQRALFFLSIAMVSFSSCRNGEDPNPAGNDNGDVNKEISLETDQVRYAPGEVVKFSTSQNPGNNVLIRYKHLNTIIKEEGATGSEWQWAPPSDDFSGYMIELVKTDGDEEEILSTIGVDVSSSWEKFPRYGFLSKYPEMSEENIESVIDNLARHHINGIQFYDWHYKHHEPLAGTPENPTQVYQDIIGRDIHFGTVQKYISAAHDRGMEAMSYNLIYGALKSAPSDGVAAEWYLYNDSDHQSINKHDLPEPPFVSDIFLVNPANHEWQEYLINENDKVYQALDFDGFHMDQLGDRGTLYNYQGQSVYLANTFTSYISNIKEGHSDKYLVLNAVNQYGQEQIADGPVSFLYTEVWSPNESFSDLAEIIQNNSEYSSGQLNTVLAAYLNYNKADNTGVFNTPGVLLADAVIFAFGGAHLELGEHMLGKEYFPNDNLLMRSDLVKALVKYYDFSVAYENLLRDGGQFNSPSVSTFSSVSLNNWPPQTGSVSVIGKLVGKNQVLHFINFADANSLQWRDTNGTQNYPSDINSFTVDVNVNGTVNDVWFASPDINGGASVSLDYTQEGNQVSFTIPSLKFWDMVVLEYQ